MILKMVNTVFFLQSEYLEGSCVGSKGVGGERKVAFDGKGACGGIAWQ